MKKISFVTTSLILAFNSMAFAANTPKHDGSDIPACAGVTDVCMRADVTAVDTKTGQTVRGYQPGEHKKNGKGLWYDCVRNLAKGLPVPGVTGVTQVAAKACKKAQKLAHPKTKI